MRRSIRKRSTAARQERVEGRLTKRTKCPLSQMTRRKRLASPPETKPVRERGGPGRGNKTSDKKSLVFSFTEDTAKKTGKSKRTVEGRLTKSQQLALSQRTRPRTAIGTRRKRDKNLPPMSLLSRVDKKYIPRLKFRPSVLKSRPADSELAGNCQKIHAESQISVPSVLKSRPTDSELTVNRQKIPAVSTSVQFLYSFPPV